jgi:SAM-dependent methyltransferase
MRAVDAVDRAVSLPFREFRDLPPNSMRIRVGVGNSVVFNQPHYLEYGAATVVSLLDAGHLTLDGRVTDIGCGCGRLAHALRRYGFRGTYEGIDVDADMVAWCRAHLSDPGFRFHHADVFSAVYNPGGRRERYLLPLEPCSQTLVLGQSLLTHLLEDEVRGYLAEAHRVLQPGGTVFMGVFCVDVMEGQQALGGRWRLRHRIGHAYVEDRRYPEAAVGYTEAFLTDLGKELGFTHVELEPRPRQSRLVCVR